MFSGLKEEKKDGKKDGDQMRITKEKLVEIIKEEIADLDEATLGGLFGRNPKRPGLKRFFSKVKGRASADPDYDPKVAMDDRAGVIDAMDSAAGLSRGGKKVYNAAVADASADASKMDAEQDKVIQSIISRFDTLDDPEEVGDSLVGDEAFVNNMRAKVASGKLFRTTFLPRIKRAIQKQMKEMPSMEGMLDDPKFIEQLANKIAQYKHTPENNK